MNREIKIVCALIVTLYGSAIKVPSGAAAPEAGMAESVSLFVDDFKQRHFEWRVVTADLVSRSRWNVASEDPWLSPKRAVEIATKRAISLVPEAIRFKARKVILEERWDFWFYIVELEPSVPVGGGYMERVRIPVLFSGSVAELVESKRLMK